MHSTADSNEFGEARSHHPAPLRLTSVRLHSCCCFHHSGDTDQVLVRIGSRGSFCETRSGNHSTGKALLSF